MLLGYLGTGSRDVHLALDPVTGEALPEPAHHGEQLRPGRRHLLRRGHADVEEEIRSMWRAGDSPAEAALDRPDVDDRRGAAVRVFRIFLPARDPLEHRLEHVAHAHDRVLVALPLA